MRATMTTTGLMQSLLLLLLPMLALAAPTNETQQEERIQQLPATVEKSLQAQQQQQQQRRRRQLQATAFSQIGDQLAGNVEDGNFATQVALAGNGKLMVISSVLDNVNVYRLEGSRWIVDGFVDTRPDRNVGTSIAISTDGSTIAVGTTFNMGLVRVFRKDGPNGDQWNQVGTNILGDEIGDQFGYSVSLSDNGNRMVVGARQTVGGSGTKPGYIRIFDWDAFSEDWKIKGETLFGTAAGDGFGWSVSLSGSGSLVAGGAIFNDDAGDSAGQVKVFRWDGVAWTQLGSNIDGRAPGDGLGFSVAFAGDGKSLAASAIFNDLNGASSGQVRVFALNANNWKQRGKPIFGTTAFEALGTSVAMSYTGTTLAIGAPSNGVVGTGSMMLYWWSSTGKGKWMFSSAQQLRGTNIGDTYGSTVSLNKDGTIVAIGAAANFGYAQVQQRKKGKSEVCKKNKECKGSKLQCVKSGKVKLCNAPCRKAKFSCKKSADCCKGLKCQAKKCK